MSDWGAGRRLALRALDIEMDPLVVAGCLGELVGAFLRHYLPFADTDLVADLKTRTVVAPSVKPRAL